MQTIRQEHKYDVTLATFTSPDRISNIAALLESWSGLVNLAYFIGNDTDLDLLEFILKDNPGRSRLTTHVVWENEGEPFPINVLRNIANYAAVTTHLFPFDIDFMPSTGLREKVLSYHTLLESSYLGISKTMLVVPALEADHGKSSEAHQKALEEEQKFAHASIEDIKGMIVSKSLKVFHDHCQKCQGATDIKRWLKADDPYALNREDYGSIPQEYEPYVIVPNRINRAGDDEQAFILWDEVFDGYGRDKTIYYFHLRQFFGYTFSVIPDACMLHRYHEKSEDSNKWRSVAGAIGARARFYFDRVRWWILFRKQTNIKTINKLGTAFSEIKARPSIKPIMISASTNPIPAKQGASHSKKPSKFAANNRQCVANGYSAIIAILGIAAIAILVYVNYMAKQRLKAGFAVSGLLFTFITFQLLTCF